MERDDAASDAYFYIHFGVHARELRGGERVSVLVEAAAVAALGDGGGGEGARVESED